MLQRRIGDSRIRVFRRMNVSRKVSVNVNYLTDESFD